MIRVVLFSTPTCSWCRRAKTCFSKHKTARTTLPRPAARRCADVGFHMLVQKPQPFKLSSQFASVSRGAPSSQSAAKSRGAQGV